MKPGSRGFTVERLASHILEEEGFVISGFRKNIEVEEVQVSEVDILAEKGGETYAVEVKAGRASTSDIRHAYANAQLLGCRALIVCRGFSDRAAERVASSLHVQVMRIPDYLFFTTPEELEGMLERSLSGILLRLLALDPTSLTDDEKRVLRAVSQSETMEEAAARLSVSKREIGAKIGVIREKALINPRVGGYSGLRLQCKTLLEKDRILEALTRIEQKIVEERQTH